MVTEKVVTLPPKCVINNRNNNMTKKKTFVRPTVTVSPFAAADILAGSGFEAGQLDFGGNGTSGTTTGGGSSNGGSFDWSTGQLGG